MRTATGKVKIKVVIGEPWELAGTADAEPLLAEVLDVAPRGDEGEAAILIRLKQRFRHEGAEGEYFVATSRYEGDDLLDLLNGRSIVSNLTAITASQAQSADPLDLTGWRGGLVLVATMRGADDEEPTCKRPVSRESGRT
jgi:hypothetical protein